ncbi:hypothetical protein CBS101457_001865 [Exobasidium rhododendri]|nr:hypothetical protein CBS101457_001865 [Exobasidium rhododendri]
MPPSHFSQVSRYRNCTLSQSKPLDRFSELSLASPPDSGVGRLLAISPVTSHIFARSSTSPNALIILPEDGTKKYGKQPPLLPNASSGQIGDFDLCSFQEDEARVLLAAGSLQGDISLQEVLLPTQERASSSSNVTTLNASTGKPINILSFHPTCNSLFLTASSQDSAIQLWDSTTLTEVQKWQAASPSWDAKWSPDGHQMAWSGKDSVVRLWDPRSSIDCFNISAHVSKVKPSKVSFIKATSPHLLLTTGFSQMRQREIAIWDQRNPSAPLKRIILDVASSALDPITDHDRGVVYLIAKGESSVRWVDVGSEDQGGSFTEGAHSLAFPATSAALGPAAKCDTSVGEIAKLFLTSSPASSGGGASASDSIIPASVRVPRRTYIDFHSDLYPLTPQRRATGFPAEEWSRGRDDVLPVISFDPANRVLDETKKTKENVSVQQETTSISNLTLSASPQSETSRQDAPTSTTANAIPTPARETPPSHSSAAPTTSSSDRVKDVPPPSRPKAAPSSQKTTSAAAVHWSRRFLAGVTPLLSAFQNLSSLDLSRAPGARMLAVSSKFYFIPIAGPGGRLGVHPLEKEGRLPLHFPSFQNGATLGDFVVDPFHDDQVITSASDGVIRLWRVPAVEDGEEWPSTLAEQALVSVPLPTMEGSNKVCEICPHPHADGLVAVIPADADGKIHLIDLKKGSIARTVGIPASGLHGAAWSPDGSVLAGAGKDKKLYILDVRGKRPEAQSLGEALTHDSPRPFNIVWIDDHHLLTVGHTIGSLRQLKLFRIDHSASDSILLEVAKQNLDVSPAILFPFWDVDTRILWLWSKGERLISTFEVQIENVKDPFLALPAFQHSQPQLGLAFLRKDCVKVKEVEIDCSIRLCKEELQRVGWRITRSRPEYFQDDVYPASALVQTPLLEADEWMKGRDAAPVTKTSLQPEGMIALSQAPPVVRTSTLSKGPTQREKTVKEREEEMLNNIFEKAKGTEEGKDPNHNEDQAARAPDVDDWDSD